MTIKIYMSLGTVMEPPVPLLLLLLLLFHILLSFLETYGSKERMYVGVCTCTYVCMCVYMNTNT